MPQMQMFLFVNNMFRFRFRIPNFGRALSFIPIKPKPAVKTKILKGKQVKLIEREESKNICKANGMVPLLILNSKTYQQRLDDIEKRLIEIKKALNEMRKGLIEMKKSIMEMRKSFKDFERRISKFGSNLDIFKANFKMFEISSPKPPLLLPVCDDPTEHQERYLIQKFLPLICAVVPAYQQRFCFIKEIAHKDSSNEIRRFFQIPVVKLLNSIVESKDEDNRQDNLSKANEIIKNMKDADEAEK